MRALLILALLIPVVTGCATSTKSSATAGPLAENPATASDITGRWTGHWIGTGLFHSPRQEDLTLDLVQRGDAGYGRMIIDGAVAAEGVPWEVRQQGLAGIRVYAAVSGPKVKIMHEVDRRIFTADMTVVDANRMVGEVKGSNVRLVLARKSPHPEAAPQAAQAAPQLPPQVPVASEPVTPEPAAVALATPTEQTEAAVTAERPRHEDYIAVPELKPIYFEFDKSALRPDSLDALSSSTAWLKENADALVLIEGNCDERGTAEYNLALGDRRAKSAMDYLEANGIAKERLSTISYGKERPVCTDRSEECMNQNRRADFRIKSR
jgi:peptidoglycan-associated lipoprotein